MHLPAQASFLLNQEVSAMQKLSMGYAEGLEALDLLFMRLLLQQHLPGTTCNVPASVTS